MATVTSLAVPKPHAGKTTTEGRTRSCGSSPSASWYREVELGGLLEADALAERDRGDGDPALVHRDRHLEVALGIGGGDVRALSCTASRISSKTLNWPSGSGVVFVKVTSTATSMIPASGCTL